MTIKDVFLDQIGLQEREKVGEGIRRIGKLGGIKKVENVVSIITIMMAELVDTL